VGEGYLKPLFFVIFGRGLSRNREGPVVGREIENE